MSIHPTAIVHDRTELADGVVLGPYAVIGEGVTLGPGVTVGAHATVSGPTVVGAHCKIFPYAAIGGDAQDKKYAGEEAFLKIGEQNIFREFTTINRGTQGGTTKDILLADF